MEENKREIVNALQELLQKTRAGEDIYILTYFINLEGDETVGIHYKDDYTKYVDVTADSGIALIRDVLKHI